MEGTLPIIDKPIPLNYILNLPIRSRKQATFHRNSLKPYIAAVNKVKVMMLSDEDGVIPNPGVSDQAGCKPSKEYPFDVAHLTLDQRRQILKLVKSYPDVLWLEPSQDAKVPAVELHTGDARPIFQHPYAVTEEKEKAVREEIESLKKYGIIRESKSPWNSPVVIVNKSNGKVRLREL